MCDSNEDYSRGGYPTRDNDSTGQMKSWVAPFILMVDRGDCTFVKKVRNAQKLGAAAVIIADSTCLCGAGDACKSDADDCETKEPIMADDGSGADITIPSFLMFKQDADPIKEKLVQNTIVRMSMSWALPRPDDRVEYDLWTTPKDKVSRPLQQNFREVAKALGQHAQFTPHMYIYDGIFAGCQGEEGEDQCYNLCTNSGRYCAMDPDEDLDSGLSGADVVTESLRRLCIWKEYGEEDGVGMSWWDYVDEFLYRCDSTDYFTNDDCVNDCMKRSGIDAARIQQCMEDSGGLTENSENSILEAELVARESAGVVILPSFFVNNAPLRGALTVTEVFDAICAGYASGSEPTACKKCNTCDNIEKCVVQGHCPGAVDSFDTVSMPVFMGTLLGVVICFGLLGIIQWQRSQRQMRSQVRGIMAEYMPIDMNTKVESIGIPTDDDDDLGVEIS